MDRVAPLLVAALLLAGCVLPSNEPPPTPTPLATQTPEATAGATPEPTPDANATAAPAGAPLPTILLPPLGGGGAATATPVPTVTPAPTPTPAANLSSCSVSPQTNSIGTPGSVTVTARFFDLPAGTTQAQIHCSPSNVGTSLISGGFASLSCVYPAQPSTSIVTLRVVAGAVECTAPLTLTADSGPPVITLLVASQITATSALFTWSTNEGATSRVEYGTTTSLGFNTVTTSTYNSSHSVNLTGLTGSTLYHYRVQSCDTANNCAYSNTSNFTTLSGAADTTAPTVTVGTPANSTYKSSSVSLNVTTSEAASTCKYSLDGGSNATMTNSSSTAWGATMGSLAEGSHNARVYCSDLAANNGTSSLVYFSVDTVTPTLSSIASGGITNSSAFITWTSSELADSWVEYGLTSSYGTNTTGNSTLATSFNTTLLGLTNGTTYYYRPWGCDSAGNCGVGAGSSFSTAG